MLNTGTSMAPYRHVEVERVVKCDHCTVREKKSIVRRTAAAAVVKPLFVVSPWLFELFRLTIHTWNITPDKNPPALGVATCALLFFASLGGVAASAAYVVKSASKAIEKLDS